MLFSGRDITGKSVEDMVYEAQRKVIMEIAEKRKLRNRRAKCRFHFKGQKRCIKCFYTWKHTGKSPAYLQLI